MTTPRSWLGISSTDWSINSDTPHNLRPWFAPAAMHVVSVLFCTSWPFLKDWLWISSRCSQDTGI